MQTDNRTEQPEAAQHGYDYDLIVIGAGSGGVRAARISVWIWGKGRCD